MKYTGGPTLGPVFTVEGRDGDLELGFAGDGSGLSGYGKGVCSFGG